MGMASPPPYNMSLFIFMAAHFSFPIGDDDGSHSVVGGPPAPSGGGDGDGVHHGVADPTAKLTTKTLGLASILAGFMVGHIHVPLLSAQASEDVGPTCRDGKPTPIEAIDALPLWDVSSEPAMWIGQDPMLLEVCIAPMRF
jgi:hypothetical protein